MDQVAGSEQVMGSERTSDMAENQTPKFYTVDELAQLLRCHPKTILRRIWSKKLLASRPEGQGYWLIPESEAKRYLNDGVNA